MSVKINTNNNNKKDKTNDNHYDNNEHQDLVFIVDIELLKNLEDKLDLLQKNHARLRRDLVGSGVIKSI
ncbi:MAG TPA: hypothetical protein VFV86_10575 [Nitrososphaeraceae archaeon]|nr:hypothetical protein [Nitrososphaeraceae archaeon]